MSAAAHSIVGLLVGIVDFAGDVIMREAHSLRLARVGELQAELDGHAAVKIEGGNPIRAEVGLLLAALFEIEEARHDRNDARGAAWCAIAFGLLQLVRANVVDAMKQAATLSRPSTTDHDFNRGGSRHV